MTTCVFSHKAIVCSQKATVFIHKTRRDHATSHDHREESFFSDWPCAYVAAAAAGGAGSGALPFIMQAQQQSNWCWSAVTTSVSHFFDSTSSWTQCSLASAEIALACCGVGSIPGGCNVPWYLDRALQQTNNYDKVTVGPAAFADVETEVDSGRPLGVRIGWFGGGGHFVSITGYSSSATNQFVTVDDPIYGHPTLPYGTLCTSYQGSGSWTHSYWTQP